jgi:hypothetical protein
MIARKRTMLAVVTSNLLVSGQPFAVTNPMNKMILLYPHLCHKVSTCKWFTLSRRQGPTSCQPSYLARLCTTLARFLAILRKWSSTINGKFSLSDRGLTNVEDYKETVPENNRGWRIGSLLISHDSVEVRSVRNIITRCATSIAIGESVTTWAAWGVRGLANCFPCLEGSCTSIIRAWYSGWCWWRIRVEELQLDLRSKASWSIRSIFLANKQFHLKGENVFIEEINNTRWMIVSHWAHLMSGNPCKGCKKPIRCRSLCQFGQSIPSQGFPVSPV